MGTKEAPVNPQSPPQRAANASEETIPYPTWDYEVGNSAHPADPGARRTPFSPQMHVVQERLRRRFPGERPPVA